MKRYSIIIPCAGQASRLGIPFSKGLYPLMPNYAIIDSIFETYVNFKNEAQFVIIIKPQSYDIINYLFKYAQDYSICYVYQKPMDDGMVGALHSAKNLFSDINFLAFPDTILKFKNSVTEYQNELLNELKKKNIVFSVANSFQIENLYDEGIVITEKSSRKVYDILDKPYDAILNYDCEQYDLGAWASVAFSAQVAEQFLDCLERVHGNISLNSVNSSLIKDISTVDIDTFYDLGEWSRIYEYIRQMQ